MSASDIAEVIGDVINKRIAHGILPLKDPAIVKISEELIMAPTVVDATVIYQGIQDKTQVNLYDDHPCVAPPWEEFIIAYQNRHGNVIVMHANASDKLVVALDRFKGWRVVSDHEVDWNRVRWEINTFVYIGGFSVTKGHVPTMGPAMLWRYAVYEDGSAADLYWVDLWDEKDEGTPAKTGLDFANFVMMGALNFLNCRNVQIVEPKRDRAERKRIEKTGVKVHEINIYPVGKRSTYTKGEPGTGVPLSSVRGYFATYTPERPLFGKYPGRFWVPQHARGKRELGERRNAYRLRTGKVSSVPDSTRARPEGSP